MKIFTVYIECNFAECNSIKEKNKSKYLVFDSTDESKEVLKKYRELRDGIKNETEIIDSSKIQMIISH